MLLCVYFLFSSPVALEKKGGVGCSLSYSLGCIHQLLEPCNSHSSVRKSQSAGAAMQMNDCCLLCWINKEVCVHLCPTFLPPQLPPPTKHYSVCSTLCFHQENKMLSREKGESSRLECKAWWKVWWRQAWRIWYVCHTLQHHHVEIFIASCW